jgi:hypothetical protein
MITDSTSTGAIATTADHTGPTRVRVAAVALAAAAATVAVLLTTSPWGERLDSSAEEIVRYQDLLAVRGGASTGMLVDGFAYAVIAISLSLGVLHLVSRRGGVAALIGAVLTTAGGILFAIGAGGFATFAWFATAPRLSAGAGPSLVAYANDHPGHLLGADMAGFLTYTVGSLIMCAALIRARAVAWVAVVAFVVVTLAQFAMPAGTDLLSYLQITQMAMLVGFAVVIWRRAGHRSFG